MRRLEGRKALVTGASSGIGRAIALRFAQEGAGVAVVDRDETPKRGRWHETEIAAPTADVIRQEGGAARFFRADLSDASSTSGVVEAAAAWMEGLDILVNNAGVYFPGSSESLTLAEWDLMMAVDLRALFITVKTAIPFLRASACGRVINISSVHAFRAGSGPAYAPAKAAVVNLTRDQAIELAPSGVTANVICPGYIETAIQDYLSAEQIEACRRRTPLPRLGRPSDVAAAALFFAGDEAEWITGQSLVVDGGYLAPI